MERTVAVTEVQREVWLAHQLDEEAALSYCMVLKLEVHGNLQRATAADAIQALYERHDALRATFSDDGEQMRIHRPRRILLETLDLSPLPPADRTRALESRLRLAVRHKHDLARGPLFSAELIALAPDHHIVLLKSHHIVCDGWSLGVLMSDFGALYVQLRDCSEPLAPAAAFSEYVGSELRTEGAQEEASGAYWAGVFADSPEPLDLPLDRPRPALRALSSARVDYPLDGALLARLEEQARSHGCSLYAALLAAFTVVMSRLAQTNDVVIGVPTSGQLRAGAPGLVGHCVNLLPLRSRVDPSVPYDALVRATHEQIGTAVRHRLPSYTRLLSRLGLQRSASRLPLASVVLTTLRLPVVDLPGVPRIVMRGEHVPREFENFELLADVFLAGAQTRIECQYNTSLYREESVHGWLGMFETVLAAAAGSFSTRVSELPLLNPDALLSLQRWNDTSAPYGRDARVHGLFEGVAQACPGRTAVVSGRLRLRYGELEAQANRLARALRARGAARGARVGLLLERGPQVVVALLAVLKSGAAYVPLDPAYPSERLAYMAEDSELSLLVTDAAAGASLAWPRERTLMPDADADFIATQADAPLPADDAAARAEDPAYVIYTSGSSGRPKAVVVPHRAVVNFLTSMAREPGLTASDRLLALTTLSFDIAVLELLLPLTVGAQVIIATADEARDAYALERLVETGGVTVMQATPAAWRMLIDAGWGGAPRLKALVGGESLPVDLAQALQERTLELWNLYGPTETTVWSTCWKVERPALGIAIGKPIANTRVRILDEERRLCPIGVPGEIYIGGDGVSLGYLNQPELTAERFVADPGMPHATLYRTGDRGRWRHDGLLEHLGRLDTQIKVRGFRVELREIEVSLASHPVVAGVVVLAREEQPMDLRLTAYVVCNEAMPAAGELRDHLRRRLPEYMIPRHFVHIDTIPRLPNGKVDHRLLPAPVQSHGAAERRFDAPRTDAERLIAKVWARLLGTTEIGITDNFFDLGGHSLLAMSAVVQIEKETGVRLQAQQMIFESLEQIALALLQAQAQTPRERGGWLRRVLRWTRV